MVGLETGGVRAVARCEALGAAPFSDEPDRLFRAWLTPAFARTQEQVAAWMADAGMSVRLDPATNLVGRYDGVRPDAPVLLIGSHLDSVRDAGRYDGPLGLMLGIEVVAALQAEARRLPFAIEVIGFGDEEGSRFPASMLTSRAVAGTLYLADLDVRDGAGTSIEAARATFDTALPTEKSGFDTAARSPGSVLAYLEAHIEQGPALEAAGLPVGVVTGIAAQLRFAVTVTGRAGHAGTTAMPLRADALAAAAEMVLAAEGRALAAGSDLVATVGRLEVLPGAPNVIPGEVRFTLDVRAGNQAVRDTAAEDMLDAFMDIADRRGVDVAIERVQDLPASPCEPRLIEWLAEAVAAEGVAPHRLVSGAGHDAMVMAALCPTAMLFVRCAGGVSHHPAESVNPADAEVALRVMRRFVDRLGEEVAA